MRVSTPKFSIEAGNVVDFRCELLVLKYAQAWYGADAAVAKRLNLIWEGGPKPGAYKVVDPAGKMPSRSVLFEGLPPLRTLTYATVRQFGRVVIEHVHQVMPRTKSIAMTLHGVSVGLDEREAFLSQLSGVVEALKSGALPDLRQVVFVEINTRRVSRLITLLEDNYPEFPPLQDVSKAPDVVPVQPRTEQKEKPHVFVAMPFSGDSEDVFIFGIQAPVQAAGILCERVDMDIFSGDILERIKSRIESSLLVIADLTGANANVYLEVGYAWGKNKDTLLLCKSVEELKFDVRGQRCVVYSSINDLNKKLTEELRLRLASV